MALEQLNVIPQDCLYIGDGSSHELTGALTVGMYPVWIRIPAEREDNFRIDEEDWNGAVISSLKEVLDLLHEFVSSSYKVIEGRNRRLEPEDVYYQNTHKR